MANHWVSELTQTMSSFAGSRSRPWSRYFNLDLAREAFSSADNRRRNLARIAAYRSASWLSRRFNPRFWGITKLIELGCYYFYFQDHIGYPIDELKALLFPSATDINLQDAANMSLLKLLNLWCEPISSWFSRLRRNLADIYNRSLSASSIAVPQSQVTLLTTMGTSSIARAQPSFSKIPIKFTEAFKVYAKERLKEFMSLDELMGNFAAKQDFKERFLHSMRIFATLQKRYLDSEKVDFANFFDKGNTIENQMKMVKTLFNTLAKKVSPDKQQLFSSEDVASKIFGNLIQAHKNLILEFSSQEDYNHHCELQTVEEHHEYYKLKNQRYAQMEEVEIKKLKEDARKLQEDVLASNKITRVHNAKLCASGEKYRALGERVQAINKHIAEMQAAQNSTSC